MPRIRTRIQLLERDVRVLFPDPLSDANVRRSLAQMAHQMLHDAQAQNQRVLGRIPPHKHWVDGREGAPFETVRPDGNIMVEFELLEDVFTFIREMLEKTSPVGKPDDPRPDHPGKYKVSHEFSADFRVLGPDDPIPPAREYAFVSAVPYARKIERGLSNQAPDGVYEVVAAMANARFSNFAHIRFTYRAPLIGDVHSWADTTKMESPYRRGEKRDTWLRRNPAIVIQHRRG
jgi:hypothetical protein